jgi:hypothetical protein
MKAIDGVLREEKGGSEGVEANIETSSDGEAGISSSSSGRGRKRHGARSMSPLKGKSSPGKKRDPRSSSSPQGYAAATDPDGKVIEATLASRGFRFGPPRAPSPPSSSNNHRSSPSSRRGRVGRPNRYALTIVNQRPVGHASRLAIPCSF